MKGFEVGRYDRGEMDLGIRERNLGFRSLRVRVVAMVEGSESERGAKDTKGRGVGGEGEKDGNGSGNIQSVTAI